MKATPIQEIPFIYVKKDKMVDGTHRRLCVSHSPFNGADFCGQGTGHVRQELKIMPIVSCFKSLALLFITVEVTIQPWLKNTLSCRPMNPGCGSLVTALLFSFHEIYSSDLLGIGNTNQKKHG